MFENNITQVIVDGILAGNVMEKQNVFFANIFGRPQGLTELLVFSTFEGAQDKISREYKKAQKNLNTNQINMF